MSAACMNGLALLALVTAYWVLDVVIRRGAPARVLAFIGLKHPALVPCLWAALTAGLATTLRWSHIPDADVILPLACGLSVMLAWRATTADLDPVFPRGQWLARLVLISAAVATYWTPACLLLVLQLLTRPFDAWRHHALMPMRVLLATTAFALLRGLSLYPDKVALDVPLLVAFVVLIHASFYFTAGVSKMWLGPRWYSWALDNRLHQMVAISYSWGWARGVSWPRWLALLRHVRRFEAPLQGAVLLAELAAPLTLLSPTSALIFCAIWSLFHIGVFALTGIFFWEWIAANAALAWSLWLLPASLAEPWFGWHAVALGLLVILFGPMRNRLWEPCYLSWWDTPLSQRIHWVVEGASGRQYGLYTRMMRPNTRLYSMAYGSFFAPVPLISYKGGAVFRRDHRDAICQAGPDPARLDALRARFGALPRHPQLAENHLAYLHRFLYALNRGRPKSIIPRFLRWLKAPVDHYYDWGDLPAYDCQEPVVRCTLRFREEYFDGARLVRLCDDVVAELTINAASGRRECTPEPTSREMEHLLLTALWQAAERSPEESDQAAAYR